MNKQNDGAEENGRSDRSAIIDRLYQVALEPEQYESLLDLWEEKVAPFRGAFDSDKFVENAIFRDQEIESHVERAGDVLDKLDDKSKQEIFQSLVDSVSPSAAFVTARSSKIIATNNAANKVYAISEEDQLNQLKLDKDLIEELTSSAVNLLQTNQKKNSTLVRLQNEDGRKTMFRLMTLDTLYEEQECILFVSTELAWPQNLSETIMDTYSLTHSEVEIIKLLVNGANQKQIASIRSRSEDTVKTQIRSILQKTETHSQSELIRVIFGLMDVVSVSDKNASDATLSNPNSGLKDRPFISITQPDGRRADHILIGKEGGKPIIYLPLDYGLIRWPASAEQFAEDNNLQIIVPVRPGYGHTSPAPNRSKYTELVLQDMLAIMDKYEISSAPFIALSNDAFFLYHLYDRYPERINAILNCGVGLPTFKAEHYSRMHKWHRFILANAKFAPSMLPFFVKAGFSLAKRIGKKGFVNTVYGNSQADRNTFENQEVYDAMVLGSEVCLSDWHSAHDAFAMEAILQQQDWSHLVRKCDIPIHIWYGHEDPQVPLATALEMKEAYPNIEFISDPKAGQLIFFKNWKEIVNKATQYHK